MSRPALAATRSAAILNFLAANPGEAFTLSDLTERLGVNVASMHALLNALTEAGYLARHPRLRTYTLGPSVVALGTAALETHPAIDLARDAARDLARETGLEVAVTTVAGDHIVFLARAGEPSPRAVPVHVGQHVPFVPPLGSVFVAWGDEEEWLAQAADADALRPILDAVRNRGYSIALEADTRKQLGHALDDLASVPADDALRGAVTRIVTDLGRREYQVVDLHPEQRYDVSMIAAPIFGPGGEVVLAITLLGFGSQLEGTEVAAHGERLRDVALVVTKRTRGRVPTSAAVVHA
jgi:DNA-binding IclR family transcriptional regulator